MAEILSLNGVASGNGASLDSGGSCSDHSIIATGAGTITAGAVQLQGSQDNVNWANLGAALTVIVGTVSLTVADTPMRYTRAIVSTPLLGGGTVSVWVGSSGY